MIVNLRGDHQFVGPGALDELGHLAAGGLGTADGRSGQHLPKDRARFERFFGWAYRFEAYTPAAKRKLGYSALPLLHDDAIIGWANVGVNEGTFAADLGYVSGAGPRGRAFRSALDDDLSRMRRFLEPRS